MSEMTPKTFDRIAAELRDKLSTSNEQRVEIERLWPARSPCCNAPLVFYDNELAQFVFWDGRRVPPGGERLRCHRCDNEVREGASENFRLFVAAVAEMRRLQREYFRTRGSGVLAAAKEAEREVDRMLKKMQSDQHTLF